MSPTPPPGAVVAPVPTTTPPAASGAASGGSRREPSLAERPAGLIARPPAAASAIPDPVLAAAVADLARDQADFAAAVTSGAPRDAGEELYARLLEGKRRAEVAHALPVLAQALGPRLPAEFARWWRTSDHDQRDFRAGVLAAGRFLLPVVAPAARPAVRAELAAWAAGGRGPQLRVARVDGRTTWWLRLTPGGRLWRFSLPG